MDRNDQQAIEQLFGRLETVERQSPPRDAEAEAFIRERIASQPGSAYYMAQTVVVQEQALQAAEARIAELEAQAAEGARGPGGLLGSLFGSGTRPTPRRAGLVPSVGRSGQGRAEGPPPGGISQPPARGGGFLAGAAQTAMGVAGGMLLANAVGGMFGADEAQAAEAEPPAGDDTAGFDDGGFGDVEF